MTTTTIRLPSPQTKGLTADKMVVTPRAPNGYPWEQFGFRYNFGNWGNTSIKRKESKMTQRKRLKETAKTPQRHKKKKKILLENLSKATSQTTESHSTTQRPTAMGSRRRKPRQLGLLFKTPIVFQNTPHTTRVGILSPISSKENTTCG
jgi:hypothetical protein